MLENTDDRDPFTNVAIMANIEDRDGQILNALSGIVPYIDIFERQSYTFDEQYTVPDDSVYFIRVYIFSGDSYPEHDTLFTSRLTTPGEVGIARVGESRVFTLGQNVPNPAHNSTRVDYTVPEAGQVLFCVHTISGQLLYSQTVEAARGTQSIELNTAMLSAGIYFYSLEYKGQRCVKRMSIK
jgi:hypothetical protein